MKSLIFITLFLISISSLGQIKINDIKDQAIQDRVKFLKAKTDFFLFSKFSKTIQRNFKFEFTNCGFFMGEMRGNYQFLNSKKFDTLDINSLTHNYSFLDKQINLKTDLNIYLYEDKYFSIQFEKTSDSLIFSSLNKIYNNGFLHKIKNKIREVKFRQYYIEIEIDNKSKTFNIIIKDKVLPHKYFIY